MAFRFPTQAACGSRRASVVFRHMMSTASAEPSVLSSATGSLRCAILNRPKVLNSLNLEMVHQMRPMVQAWDEDSDVNVIVLKGAGEKALCAGGDVVSVAKSGRGGDDGGALARDFFREEYILDYQLAKLKTPYVAFMDGIVMGGGVGLSFPAPFRIATERSLFAMPETGIGLFPDVGGSFYLPKLEGELGMYLALTGARLKGADVVKAGVATHFVPSERLADVEDALAQVGKSADTRADVAAVLAEFATSPSDADSTSAFANHMDEINECFHGDSVDHIMENLELSATEWATKQRDTILRMSPTSVKITHLQLRLGAKMSLEECFKMEYRMTQGCMRSHDFFEGIRALLIDKDKSPKWNPATLAEVTGAIVDSHFTPVDNDLELQE
eukprot:m.227623 g.227623  ORF g.227623 m.227623 type:complete len:387 (+) comp19250_c0_seq2:70-1230(+)